MIALLSAAALAPQETYEALSRSSTYDIVDQFNVHKESRAKTWSQIEARASDGDADAMFRVANRLLHRWSAYEEEMVPPDSAGAERLFRAAAELGHVLSMVAVWRIEGMDAKRLIKISDYAIEQGAGKEVLGEVSYLLNYFGVNSCQSELIQAAELVQKALESAGGENIFKDVNDKILADISFQCPGLAD